MFRLLNDVAVKASCVVIYIQRQIGDNTNWFLIGDLNNGPRLKLENVGQSDLSLWVNRLREKAANVMTVL